MGTMGTWGRRKNNQSTALILRPPQQASARKERMVGGAGLSNRRRGRNHLGLYREVEGATFEGQHGAIVVSCALRKDPDTHLRKKEGQGRQTHTKGSQNGYDAVMRF